MIYVFRHSNLTTTVPSLTSLSDMPIKEVLFSCCGFSFRVGFVLFCLALFCFLELPIDSQMAYGGDGEGDGILCDLLSSRYVLELVMNLLKCEPFCITFLA